MKISYKGANRDGGYKNNPTFTVTGIGRDDAKKLASRIDGAGFYGAGASARCTNGQWAVIASNYAQFCVGEWKELVREIYREFKRTEA